MLLLRPRVGAHGASGPRMQSVLDHYAKLLSPIYAWSAGGMDAALGRGAAELDALGLKQGMDGARAVDLGAGFGMHSIPLARRGFSVLAVDSSRELLRDLAAHAAGLPITTTEADLLTFRNQLDCKAQAVLCMGDTLTHLPSMEDVESLIAEVAAALDAGGMFVLTFRDYSTALLAEQRFISVRSDADRILTCCLEYEDAHVTVHDLLHEREGAQWKLHVSSYRKLRLAPHWVAGALESRGFRVSQDVGLSGMVRLVARLSRAVPASSDRTHR